MIRKILNLRYSRVTRRGHAGLARGTRFHVNKEKIENNPEMNRIFCNFRVVSHKFCLKNVHTCLVACARTNEPRKNPGISKRAEVFKDDVDFIESLEDEEDIAGLESNFADADVSYHEHKR